MVDDRSRIHQRYARWYGRPSLFVQGWGYAACAGCGVLLLALMFLLSAD